MQSQARANPREAELLVRIQEIVPDPKNRLLLGPKQVRRLLEPRYLAAALRAGGWTAAQIDTDLSENRRSPEDLLLDLVRKEPNVDRLLLKALPPHIFMWDQVVDAMSSSLELLGEAITFQRWLFRLPLSNKLGFILVSASSALPAMFLLGLEEVEFEGGWRPDLSHPLFWLTMVAAVLLGGVLMGAGRGLKRIGVASSVLMALGGNICALIYFALMVVLGRESFLSFELAIPLLGAYPGWRLYRSRLP